MSRETAELKKVYFEIQPEVMRAQKHEILMSRVTYIYRSKILYQVKKNILLEVFKWNWKKILSRTWY
jgi:hypothetical protein